MSGSKSSELGCEVERVAVQSPSESGAKSSESGAKSSESGGKSSESGFITEEGRLALLEMLTPTPEELKREQEEEERKSQRAGLEYERHKRRLDEVEQRKKRTKFDGVERPEEEKQDMLQ